MHRTAADARAPRVELSPPDYLAELVERTVRVTARLGALPAASKEHAGTCAELQMLLSRQDMYATAEGVVDRADAEMQCGPPDKVCYSSP